jgi:hypothetical protein
MPPIALFVILLVLWVFPLWIFRDRKSRLGGFDQRTWPSGRNLVLAIADLLRASLGGALLAYVAANLPSGPFASGWGPAIWMACALAVALAANAFSWRDEDYLLAPVVFLLGALPALQLHPLVLLMTIPLAIGGALAVRAWTAGLIGAGLGLIGIGMLVVEQDWRRSLLLGFAVMSPVVLSMLAGRHLATPRK